jgi:hypothetical protein
VDDYARDGENLLLANPNNPEDLREKLHQLLTDSALADRLIEGGFRTIANRYDWSQSLERFVAAIRDIDATYPGAGEVNLPALEQALADLDREGSLTPIETYREFHELSSRLSTVASAVAASPPTDEQILELERISRGLKRHATNERAQYYGAFKAKYDLCTLVLALAATPDRIHVSRLLHPMKEVPTSSHASALTEIRYTEP